MPKVEDIEILSKIYPSKIQDKSSIHLYISYLIDFNYLICSIEMRKKMDPPTPIGEPKIAEKQIGTLNLNLFN